MEQMYRNNIITKLSKFSLAVIINNSNIIRLAFLTVILKGEWVANLFFLISERQEKWNIHYRNESKQEEGKEVRATLNCNSESKIIPTRCESTT